MIRGFQWREYWQRSKEQESVYISYINNGAPTAKYLSVESINNANIEGFKYSINETFHSVVITDFKNRLGSLNTDGASVSISKHKGLSAKLRELAPWLMVIKCFDHGDELVIKMPFKPQHLRKLMRYFVCYSICTNDVDNKW